MLEETPRATTRLVVSTLALTSGALALGLAASHPFQMPPRLEWSPRLWIASTVEGDLYGLYGTVGTVIESLAWMSAFGLAWLNRRADRWTRACSLVAAAGMFVPGVVWWLYVYPVNSRMITWSASRLPENFEAMRRQWEFAHGARAAIFFAGFLALSLAVSRSPRQR